MKSDKLQEAIGLIDPDLILRAEKQGKKNKTKTFIKWTSPIAAILVIALAIGIFFGSGSPFTLKAYAIAEAEYPRAVWPMLETCYRELGNFQKAYEYVCKQR